MLAALGRIIERGMPFARYLVEGPSMEPAYRDGERLVVNRYAYWRKRPAIGDVVVLRDPDDSGRYLLKRIAKAPDGMNPGRSRVYVLGDNIDSSRDSREFGLVPRKRIIGRVWFRY